MEPEINGALRSLPDDIRLLPEVLQSEARRLQAFAMTPEALMQRPETAEQRASLARGLTLLPLILRLLAEGERRPVVQDLCLDVAHSVYERVSQESVRLAAQSVKQLIVGYGSPATPLLLSPQDMEAAQSRLCACALEWGLPLPPEFCPDGALYAEPDAQAPTLRELPLSALRPLFPSPTLAAWLDEAPSELEQAAILGVWWVQERGQYENRPIAMLLSLCALCVSAAQDIRRERGLALDRTQDLRAMLARQHAELKDASGQGIRIQSLSKPLAVRQRDRDALCATARSALVEFYQGQSGQVSLMEEEVTSSLWRNFDLLDQLVQLGNIEPEFISRFQLFHALAALFQTRRAPGMRTPLIVELAAELSGIDPLWGWQFTQEDTATGDQIMRAFAALCLVLRANVGPQPEHIEPLRRLMGQFGGHLFALCRSAGLRLPHQNDLMVALLADHPVYGRSSPLSPQVFSTLVGDIQTIYSEIAAQVLSSPSADETVAEAPAHDGCLPVTDAKIPDGPTTPEADYPPHVLEVRRLLAGRPITLLAGIRKASHHQALEQALGAEVDWVESGEYAHGTHAASRITSETGVVVLGIRWMGHAHNGLRDVAREQDVPCVMHPGGLSPSSVAYQILQQAGRQLGERTAR